MAYRYGERHSGTDYKLSETDLTAVGMRLYGPVGGKPSTHPSEITDEAWAVINITNYPTRSIVIVGNDTIPEGEYVDIFEGYYGRPDNPGTLMSISEMLTRYSKVGNKACCFYRFVSQTSAIYADFAFIFDDDPTPEYDELVTEHIARFEITDSATVKFSRQHPVYGIYGENILASFDENFQEGDQGVYDTSATGTTIMENHQQKDTIYLKGSGTVTVWAGSSAVAFPFKALGKGGGSGGGTIYRTSTTLHDGDTTNPITVDGQDVTVKSGDFAISGMKEFIFDGTYWDELGDMSGLGALAYKDNASGTLTGTAVNVSVTGTPSGSISVTPTTDSVASVTNKGTLPSFSYNSTTEELTFNAGTLPTTTNKTVMTGASATFSGTSTTSTGTVTAEGSVTVS